MSEGGIYYEKMVKPSFYEKNLATNQSVAVSACIAGKIQCQYPGNGSTDGQDAFDDYNAQQSGWYTDSEGKKMVFVVMMQILHLLVQQVQVMKKRTV